MKYANQKDLEYTFITKDGSIELSKFSLQHSDFYTEQIEGPELFNCEQSFKISE